MKNFHYRMKMTIRLLSTTNTGIVLPLMTRSLTLMTLVARVVPGMDLGMGFRNGMVGIGIQMRVVIDCIGI